MTDTQATSVKVEVAFRSIPLEHLRPSSTEAQMQRRKYFDKAKLDELAESIAAHGVFQPIVVRQVPAESTAGVTVPGHYQIVAGERRYVASKMAKRADIPAIVLELTDEEVIEVQLIENLQREDVHPMHEAEGYHELVHTFGHPIEEVYSRVGKSRSYVYGRMKLLALAPALRKVFYEGEIDASVALLLARIPAEETQLQAFKAVTANDWSYRDAARIIREQYMLRLSEATFPTADPDLAGAGPCGVCPKRTGNQKELFGDVKSADVCTDLVCFQAKTRAFGQRQIDAARAAGRTVIAGAQAKKIAPHGADMGHLGDDYLRVDDDVWQGTTKRKVKSLLTDDTEIAVLQDPKTGEAVEVVKSIAVENPSQRARGVATNSMTAAEKKRKLENRLRFATYAAVRAKLSPPSLVEIAGSLFRRLEHDATKILCKIRSFEPPTRSEKYRGKVVDYAAVGKGLETLPDAELHLFINDCIYVRELMYGDSMYRDAVGIPKIADLAKKHRVDMNKIRHELTPKKKTKAPPKKKAKR